MCSCECYIFTIFLLNLYLDLFVHYKQMFLFAWFLCAFLPQLSSPTSLLQLQQLQTLQQLQQQLLQQTQVSQHQFHQHTLQHPHQTTAVQLTANDQVVLAQAKQIEELQRQLQESHLKLKLQQLQQQHMQLQQQQQHHHQQQQQQQQLWQVQIPANFTQVCLVCLLFWLKLLSVFPRVKHKLGACFILSSL